MHNDGEKKQMQSSYKAVIDYFDDVAAILNRDALWVGQGAKFREMCLFYLLLAIAWTIF